MNNHAACHRTFVQMEADCGIDDDSLVEYSLQYVGRTRETRALTYCHAGWTVRSERRSPCCGLAPQSSLEG